MSLECLGCTSVEVIEQSGTLEEGFTRRIRVRYPVEAPRLVRRALSLGESITSIEEGRFDAATGRWSFRWIPSTMPDKVKISGELWLEERDGGGVERVLETDVSAKVFGVGPVIERLIEFKAREGQDKIVRFTQEYLARAGAAD